MNRTIKTIALLGAGVMMTVSLAQAGGHLGAVKERQEAMKSVGGGMKVIVGTMKGKMDFDAAKIKMAALTIKANLHNATKFFPEGSGEDSKEENRAKPEIWLDPEGFAASMKKAIAAADNMAGVTSMADLGPALGQLGAGCKGCHEKYRAPKK